MNEQQTTPLGCLHTRLANHGDVVVVHVEGEVDMNTHPILVTATAEGLDRRPTALVVHLGGVEFFSSVGLEALLALGRGAQERRSALALVACSYAVRRVLDVTGLRSLFTEFDTVEAAIAALSRAPRWT